MDKRATKRSRAEAIAAELAKATDPAQVGKLLRMATLANIPDAALKSAGNKLPGYRFNADQGKYTRRPEATARSGSLAVSATLADLAADAFPVVERSYGVIVDKTFPWSLASRPRTARSGSVVASINRAPSAKGRAQVVCGDLSVREALLATANAKGSWSSLPNGNMGGAGVVDILSNAAHKAQVKPAIWGVHPASEASQTPLVYRREPLLEVAHTGIPVVKATRAGSKPAVGDANRACSVFKDTVFAVEPTLAPGLIDDHDMLEEIYGTGGEGMDNMIVPAAGFLVMRQLVGVVPRG